MSVDFLPELDDSSIKVEIAWGADIAADDSGWTWTDITSDVRIAEGISITQGRADEASTSQPANITVTLDNADDSYSLGGISPNWPNVRRNTPVRVSVDVGDGSGFVVIGQGFADGFTPSWLDTEGGQIPVVSLSASGLLRRLNQHADPVGSALYRWHTLTPPFAPTDYWPIEEDKTATFGLSATGGQSATIAPLVDSGVSFGKVNWGSDTDNPATERAAAFSAGASMVCPVADTSAFDPTGTWAVTWLMRYTSISGAGVTITTSDVSWSLTLNFNTDGSIEVFVTQPANPFADPVVDFEQGSNTGWDDIWHAWGLVVNNTGATPNLSLWKDGIEIDSTITLTGATDAVPTAFTSRSAANPGGTEDPVTIGHVSLWAADPMTPTLTYESAIAAWIGEAALDRLSRLGTEQGFTVNEFVGEDIDTAMGPQLSVSLVNLLRECETADQGVLADGFNAGLSYFSRTLRENADLALGLTADELYTPFAPTDDDQHNRNRVTVSTTGSNSKFQFEDTDGPLGIDAIGLYDSSVTVNIADQSHAVDYASWLVHLGTVEGYRYPSFTINLRANPTLAGDVTALQLSNRVAIDNTAGTLAGLPAEVFGALIEGMSQHLDPYNWTLTANLSPAETWSIAVVAEESGDDGDFLFRLDADAPSDTTGAAVTSNVSAGATSISVTTRTGPLWTTNSDNFPFFANVGGVKVRVDSITGASSPQTFAVDGDTVVKAITHGAPVTVWNPPVLGL